MALFCAASKVVRWFNAVVVDAKLALLASSRSVVASTLVTIDFVALRTAPGFLINVSANTLASCATVQSAPILRPTFSIA